jgi:energy-coupling factor transporter ATP-binding protein EcfA2
MIEAADTYVSRREEEAEILRRVEEVRESGRSRALLLHGPGGSGKTMLVRHLAAQAGMVGGDVVWVRPIDVDDSEYWLLSNLESEVAAQLGRQHFERYFDRLRGVARSRTSRSATRPCSPGSAGSIAPSSTATASSSKTGTSGS